MPARPVFIGGTGSHVGKSWIATALCRYLHRMGRRVAPFKAQNMSNNSMVCPGGGEIGRAQVAQAEACGLPPHTDMNPILLKPTGDMGSQVVVNGRAWRNLRAAEYYEHFPALLEHVLAAYARLAADYEYIVIEGAGSITELNLKHRDLVNMGLAERVKAPAILVADIDRGGVFASVIGTFHLLNPTESSLVRSFLVNRFRGDLRLFDDGVRILEEKTGRPCLGVFPFARDIEIDPEDSVSLEDRKATTGRVAIIRLPHISNFTDFRLLPDAVYVSQPVDQRFDTIFLPGTKSTIEDMLWLRSSGLERWILEQHGNGAQIIGVCGGFQMLGQMITDPHRMESDVASVRGLGLIAADTTLATEKTTRTVRGRTSSGVEFEAYEIHMGVTALKENAPAFALVDGGGSDGVRLPRVVGTYLHGAFENESVLRELLGASFQSPVNHTSKDVHYDRLADWFAAHVDHEVLTREYLV
jgi:adenosylcobyric acid synthase